MYCAQTRGRKLRGTHAFLANDGLANLSFHPSDLRALERHSKHGCFINPQAAAKLGAIVKSGVQALNSRSPVQAIPVEQGQLPPVLPLVLYNGESQWTAATDIADLILPVPDELFRYRQQMRYLVVDEGRYSEAELALSPNLVAALFRLEQSRTVPDVRQVLRDLLAWLNAPQQTELRRAFAVWLGRVLLPSRMPNTQIPEMKELQEVETMLAERVKEWTREWREEGFQEGREEGCRYGEAVMLIRLLERKFGAVSEDDRQRIHAADADTLLRWSERVLTETRLDAIFR